MSQVASLSTGRPYGLAMVCRVWEVCRSSVYVARARRSAARRTSLKRGPRTGLSDEALLEKIRQVLAASPFLGEGYRKVWARLRLAGIGTAKGRVLRCMREAGLLAPTRQGHRHGPKAHDGAIVPELPNELWGTDATSCITAREGTATIFVALDHATAECVGIHAARPGTRFEALEPLRQGVQEHLGSYHGGVAQGLSLRHDHGSQYMSDSFQAEIRFLGITPSPAFVREPEGNGCVERFIRTLKEQLLWVSSFQTVEELRQALLDFKERYNRAWLIERHGFRPPAARRAELVAAMGPVV